MQDSLFYLELLPTAANWIVDEDAASDLLLVDLLPHWLIARANAFTTLYNIPRLKPLRPLDALAKFGLGLLGPLDRRHGAARHILQRHPPPYMTRNVRGRPTNVVRLYATPPWGMDPLRISLTR